MGKQVIFRTEGWMIDFLDAEAKAKECKRSDVIRFGLTYFMFAVKSGFFEGKDPMKMAEKMKNLIDEMDAED